MDEAIEQGENVNPQNRTKEKGESNEHITFLQAVYKLNLPQRNDGTGKGKKDKQKNFGMPSKKQSMTSFDPMNPFHMVQVLDLSNFRNRGFCTSAFKELLDSISEMRCLNKLILANNGIGPDQVTQLGQLFMNTHITHLDLSSNDLDKTCASFISDLLKEEVSHFQWLKLTNKPVTQPDVPYCFRSQAIGCRFEKSEATLSSLHFRLEQRELAQ
jgi:hypothetical protein